MLEFSGWHYGLLGFGSQVPFMLTGLVWSWGWARRHPGRAALLWGALYVVGYMCLMSFMLDCGPDPVSKETRCV